MKARGTSACNYVFFSSSLVVLVVSPQLHNCLPNINSFARYKFTQSFWKLLLQFSKFNNQRKVMESITRKFNVFTGPVCRM